MSDNKKLFLSAVSSEFVSYRNLLAGDLHRPNLELTEQDEIEKLNTGGTTLEKLDDYIRQCDAVIHLIGKAAGALPKEPAVAALLAKYPNLGTRLPPLAEHLKKPQPGFSYTQWEAYLALYHQRPVFVYRHTDFERDGPPVVPRGGNFIYSPAGEQSQREHYRRICERGHDRGTFANEERLSTAVLRDLVEILPRLESTTDVSPTRLRHTAERLIGREGDLTRLDAAWNNPSRNVVVVRAFGGMGKTSLVATWMAELASRNWRGATRVFDWSFYSQGTRDQGAASADTFIAEALHTFGDPNPTLGSPWDRGARLAKLVAKKRCLLVLDGLEPLQHPPGPMEGQLKDAAVSALLKGLAAQNAGLCVITTREKVDDIKQHYGRAVDDVELSYLTAPAGAALLYYAGSTRAGGKEIGPEDTELQKASEEVKGHGLTLQLLGQYLKLAEDGDILKRDTVRLADADKQYVNDATRPYGHAFKAMEAYEKWFDGGGVTGKQQLAILRLLGLFDRPASKSCLDTLRTAKAIVGLTDMLVGLNPIEWKVALGRLEQIKLLAIQPDGSVDCHPLLREYFAERLRMRLPDAWRKTHKLLYEHLCTTTKEGSQPTLEALQPLYQAVAHGCQAWLYDDVLEDVYKKRIQGIRGVQRRQNYYATRTLGLYGSDLAALACFFTRPWDELARSLGKGRRAFVLRQTAFSLRAVGRLLEAQVPAGLALKAAGTESDPWGTNAIAAGMVSEIHLALGDMANAVRSGRDAVELSDRSQSSERRVASRCTLADALHQAGECPESLDTFKAAETIKAKDRPDYPLLHSTQAFGYHERLLTEVERSAWAFFIAQRASLPLAQTTGNLLADCREVERRATLTLGSAAKRNAPDLSTGIDRLTLARVMLYVSFLRQTGGAHSVQLEKASQYLSASLDDLRRAGQQQFLLPGLLTSAWFLKSTGAPVGPDSAQTGLDEAWDIAERGPMRLHMADIHLHRARLFFREAKYPWNSPRDDLAAARKLIESCGYWRRKEELEDAEAVILK